MVCPDWVVVRCTQHDKCLTREAACLQRWRMQYWMRQQAQSMHEGAIRRFSFSTASAPDLQVDDLHGIGDRAQPTADPAVHIAAGPSWTVAVPLWIDAQVAV